jgi:hypothetical protein
MHAQRPLQGSLIETLVHRHDVGGVLVCRLDVFGLEVGVAVEKLVMADPCAQLAENMLNRQPSPLEHGLAQHHAFAFLDVVLPSQCHCVRSGKCHCSRVSDAAN